MKEKNAAVRTKRTQEDFDLEEAIRKVWRAYRAKGHSESWIRKRLQGIAVREELTDVWHDKGVERGEDFKLLTEDLSRAIFDLIPSEYRQLKQLPDRENLRDHMTDLELIFSMLGEAAAAEIARNQEGKNFPKLWRATQEGGIIAGRARRSLESRIGYPIISVENFLKKEQDAV